MPPRIRADFDDFMQCQECGKVYWPGSHYDRMQAMIEALKAEA